MSPRTGRRSIARTAAATLLALGAVAAASTVNESAARDTFVRLATTTSTENSGLLGTLLPPFERRYGTRVHVIAVGSGKAMKLGENGDVDLILSHAPILEEKFMRAGWGVDRRPVMHNDFVIVGTADDPAGINTSPSAAEALRRIARSGSEFVSRGDESGTHQKEMTLWNLAGVAPRGAWYLSAGLGMGKVLLMAGERRAYTLTDRGTFLSYRAHTGLKILFEGDPPLHNPYTVMAVNPEKHRHTKHRTARLLIDWLTSPDAQAIIRDYKVEGQNLFFPDAVVVGEQTTQQ